MWPSLVWALSFPSSPVASIEPSQVALQAVGDDRAVMGAHADGAGVRLEPHAAVAGLDLQVGPGGQRDLDVHAMAESK